MSGWLSDRLGSNRTASLTWHHHGFLISGPNKFDELFKFKFGQMGEILEEGSVSKFLSKHVDLLCDVFDERLQGGEELLGNVFYFAVGHCLI